MVAGEVQLALHLLTALDLLERNLNVPSFYRFSKMHRIIILVVSFVTSLIMNTVSKTAIMLENRTYCILLFILISFKVVFLIFLIY